MAWALFAWTFCRYLAALAYTAVMSVTACLLCVIVGPTRMWQLVQRPWGRGTLWLAGVRLDVEGSEHLRSPAAVFVSNHQSLIDVVFMPALLPRNVRLVAKRELLWVPFLGWAFAAGGAVLVDRARPRQALAAIRRGLRRLPPGWGLMVFPEGTRPPDGQMRRFKRGAFTMACEARLPVVPIGLDGAAEIVPPGAWVVRAGVVRVTVGPPIDSSTTTADDVEPLLQRSQAAVAQCVARSRARRPAAAAAPEALGACPL